MGSKIRSREAKAITIVQVKKLYRLDSILTAVEIVRSDNLKIEQTGLGLLWGVRDIETAVKTHLFLT